MDEEIKEVVAMKKCNWLRSFEFINACPSLKQVYKYLKVMIGNEHNVSKLKWYYYLDRQSAAVIVWKWHFSST